MFISTLEMPKKKTQKQKQQQKKTQGNREGRVPNIRLYS
jgi:hypothetical protein